MKKKLLSLLLCFGMLAICFVNPIVVKADTIQAAVTEVKLNKSIMTIKAGQSSTLKATIYPISSNYLTVSFKASNSNISLKRKTNNSVTVTGKKAGQATITAIARATGSSVDVTAKCKVIVSKGAVIAPKSVTVSPASKNVYIGDTYTLKATVSPANATNKNVTWKSSDINIATVDSKGKVKGMSTGVVTITATVMGTNIKSTCKVTVKNKKLEISPSSATLSVGKQKKIQISKLEPRSSKIIWKTSNPEIATVDSQGNVKAKKKGKATITASIYGANVKKKCTVTVK